MHNRLAFHRREDAMEDHVYRVIEITGSSQKSIEDAIQTAVTRAAKTLRNLRWFEVVHGKVSYYQAVLKLGFTVEDA
jgi:flavin-binding protein dodecin